MSISEKHTYVAPRCIGVIMDGNRRWARQHGLPTLEGHRQGYECLLRCRSFAREKGIQYIVLYAFSTENWRRAREEVNYLMQLFRTILRDEWRRLEEEQTRVLFIGEREKLTDDIQQMMRDMEERTREYTGITLVVALSYGARAEIIDAAQHACMETHGGVIEQSFAQHLWTAGIPDPDLIIRTGGAHRLSNFLLWQAAYAELYFTDVLWPDFDRNEFEKAFEFFVSAKRKFGA